jgi:hypothetical protein
MPVRFTLRASLPVLLSAQLLASLPARAATFCADTTQELVLSLASAAQSAEDDEVRVRSGTFSLTGNIDLTINGALNVRGGWSLNCLLQSNDPGSSRITTATPGQYGIVLRPRDGDLTVERLTFDRLDGVVLQDIGNSASVVGDIRLARNRFIINDFGPILRARDKNLRVENNIVSGSLQRTFQVDRSVATAPFVADIHNNTFVGGTEGARITGTLGTVRLRNNVMDGSYAAGGIVIVDGVVTVNHNSLDGGFSYIGGGSASPSFDNDLVIDPMFDATFVPQAGSPLINSGTNSIAGGAPSTDYAGATRRIGSRIDRGARESTISDLDTLTVTSSANSGAGTLRQAILDANVTAIEETIAFDIAGSCPRTITLNSPLPTVSDTLTLDGFTQPGSSPNTEPDFDDSVHCIALSTAATTALNLTPGPDQEITVRGLAIYGATDAAIRVSGSGRATIVGNTFNTGTPLATIGTPAYAISVDAASDTLIGGNDVASRNIIGLATTAGVRLGPGTGRRVVGNFIGVAKSGNDPVGNQVGVLVVDGQLDALTDNAIGNNTTQGIRVEGANSELNLQRNLIGASPNPTNAFNFTSPNGTNGIRLVAGRGFFLRNNTIAFNGTDGLAVLAAVQRADFSVNRFDDNDGLGVDLSPNGVNTIDTDTGAVGANGGQNFPVLLTAGGGDNSGTVGGRLQSANGEYDITIYRSGVCNASGYGEAEVLVGGGSVAITNGTGTSDGEVLFNLPVSYTNSLDGRAITALATERGGAEDGNTSEFSACIEYTSVELFSDGFEP